MGGLTIYTFGDPAAMHDPARKLAVRVHDECNGWDVFGSDICTGPTSRTADRGLTQEQQLLHEIQGRGMRPGRRSRRASCASQS
jgi:GTP cyclohydrolase II